MSSHRATTAVVRDLPMSREDLTEALAGYDESVGDGSFTPAELAQEVGDVLALAACWLAGTVLELRLDLIRVRSAFT